MVKVVRRGGAYAMRHADTPSGTPYVSFINRPLDVKLEDAEYFKEHGFEILDKVVKTAVKVKDAVKPKRKIKKTRR